MSANQPDAGSAPLRGLPPALRLPDVRQRIRERHRAAGRRFVVLDDDPTGSQCVHDVWVVPDTGDSLGRALDEPGSTAFVLTNTRSMSQSHAQQTVSDAADDVAELSRRLGAPVIVVSRGDSTLRGHVMAELEALDASRRRATGSGFDAVLLVPAYLEAGRFTVGDVHWAVVGGRPVPVGESEFSRDATFGYRSSDLCDYVQEKTGGRVSRDDVLSIGLDDIRVGGLERVSQILATARGGRFVVVNAAAYDDLDVVALALAELSDAGRSFVCRCGPSFVAALTGTSPRGVLTSREIHATGRAQGRAQGHGLVVVGSHVGLTTAQVQVVLEQGCLTPVEMDVGRLVDEHEGAAYRDECIARVAHSLRTSDVVLYTSRVLTRGADAEASLTFSRSVSWAVTQVVGALVRHRPAWLVAKGGITSHDLLVHGLEMTRGRVMGQLLPGMVTIIEPVDARPEARGMPYVVFAGNVGTEATLLEVVQVMSGRQASTGDHPG